MHNQYYSYYFFSSLIRSFALSHFSLDGYVYLLDYCLIDLEKFSEGDSCNDEIEKSKRSKRRTRRRRRKEGGDLCAGGNRNIFLSKDITDDDTTTTTTTKRKEKHRLVLLI